MGRKVYETTEYAAMMRRMVSAYGRRVGDADPEDLAAMLELQSVLAESIQAAVSLQRSKHGRSWADIARGAGTSRQAAQMKWGKTESKAGDPGETPWTEPPMFTLEESSKSEPPATAA
jgi:Flp pilus assembly CpaE family ATPase